MKRVLAFIGMCCLVLWSTTMAMADPSRMAVSLKKTVSGKEQPAIILKPKEKVASVTVKLKRDDGKKQTLRASNIAGGSTKSLTVRQEPGTFAYEATFNIKWAKGKSSKMTMKFSLTRTKKLELNIKAEDVDLDKRTMSFTINNPAMKATLDLVGEDGETFKTVTKKYNNAKAGTKLTISYPEPDQKILYMDLKVYDVTGFWKGVRLTPLSVSIPHDDVEFESGKHNIRKSEEPKLEATLKKLKEAIEKFSKHNAALSLKLYIAGYTDTVGSKSSNQRLSENRARSIARWFRKNGIKIKIFYQGFGEEVLAVKTPDETDEARNRRAIYILASQMPAKSDTIPKKKWKGI